jgi:hypothetical protein
MHIPLCFLLFINNSKEVFMNFNFNNQPEYQLHTTMTEEMIRLYGVLTKFLITEKINQDNTVFGDYSHMKSDNSKIYDIYMLPEESSDWDTSEYNMNAFGLGNFENIVMFVAKSNFDGIIELPQITGNIIVLPNNKVMEITDTDPVVPGINNLFTHNDAKSVYKITCKPHEFKLINELDNSDVDYESGEAETLDVYFQELLDTAFDQDTEAEVTDSVTTVNQSALSDTKVKKPIIDNTEDDIWGNN